MKKPNSATEPLPNGAPAFLFKPSIDGQRAWAEHFQSKEAFAPLAAAILDKHGLPPEKIENLTPGTNAVFRAGGYVIKIFAPKETGFGTGEDYFIELAAMRHANRTGVAAPQIVCEGCMQDSYLFRYIVMAYTSGQEAEHALPTFTDALKIDFARKIKAATEKMNIPCSQPHIPRLQPQACMDNPRWEALPESLRREGRRVLESPAHFSPVFTHGDLTGENVLVSGGEICILDFADSHIAPHYYEWPPLVFSLFGCDPTMMTAYFGDDRHDDRRDAFYDTLTLAVLMHDFGAPIIGDLCRAAGTETGSVTGISALKALLKDCVENVRVKLR